MAKNTREVKQYEVYVLMYQEIGEEGHVKNYYPVAIFDDMDILDAYISANIHNGKELTEKESFDVEAEWKELEPVAENYSHPFNPAPPTLPEEVKTEEHAVAA